MTFETSVLESRTSVRGIYETYRVGRGGVPGIRTVVFTFMFGDVYRVLVHVFR